MPVGGDYDEDEEEDFRLAGDNDEADEPSSMTPKDQNGNRNESNNSSSSKIAESDPAYVPDGESAILDIDH